MGLKVSRVRDGIIQADYVKLSGIAMPDRVIVIGMVKVDLEEATIQLVYNRDLTPGEMSNTWELADAECFDKLMEDVRRLVAVATRI